jgi:methylthioribose-1-phosphate isomerase
VQLNWVLGIMRETLRRLPAHADVSACLLQTAGSIAEADREANLTMGRLGMQLIRRHQKAPQKLMVHGYGGALATAGYGTALGVVRAAHSAGLVEQVLVNESRPWLQGARLTAWELVRDGIATRLHVDSAAAHVMQRNSVSWVVVGADRIAANGDVINRIGTYGLSILALHHGLRFMVVASTATIDMTLADGDELSVEERGSSELLQLGERCIDAGAPASNPVSDVTPADLIDAIVTEKGVIERPDARKIADLMSVRRLH